MTLFKRKCASCGKRRVDSQYAGPGARVCNPCKKKTARLNARKAHLWKTYELTLEDYAALLEAQEGVCAVCKGGRPYNLAVDHDHSLVGQAGIRLSIRGLLCKRCNKVLRDVRDDAWILHRMIGYLHEPPAWKILFARPHIEDEPADE